jgi:hypothetical protein
MKFPFLREEKVDLRTQVTFTGSKMDIYLPSYYLESGESMAVILGRRVECIGIFWFSVGSKYFELQIPVKISFEFTERSSERKRLMPGMPELDYDVFTLTNGDAFVHDVNHKESTDDIIFFIQKLVEGAKLPPTLSYEEIMSIYLKALEVTKINSKLGVNLVTLEFIMSELYRDRRNLSKPFRLSYNGKSVGPYDYRMLRIVKIPEQNSVFTGITGEDTNQQLISAVLRTREGKGERPSPIEKIIKY